MDEVERAQSRLLSLEREKGLLRSQLQTADEENSTLENSLSAKEKIISELHMELHNIESTLANERNQHIDETKKLIVQRSEKEVALQEMKEELEAGPTLKVVEDLRKKVKILQAVGYNSIEAEDWDVATSGEEISKLEFLLLDKNKKMEHKLTQLKIELSEKTSLLEAAESNVSQLSAKVDEQQKLIQKLEDDISKSTDNKHISSDQDQSSMLKVICNQRDRFRARLRESEEEVRLLKDKIRGWTDELEKTKADNIKLYGKIRYVQDYNMEKVVSRGSKKHAEDLESGFSSDVETKYKKMYEDDINPFAAFSNKERDQRYKELGLRDRLTLTSGHLLLGNKHGSEDSGVKVFAQAL
ncbi:CASP-like protein [Drosera capensis]